MRRGSLQLVTAWLLVVCQATASSAEPEALEEPESETTIPDSSTSREVAGAIATAALQNATGGQALGAHAAQIAGNVLQYAQKTVQNELKKEEAKEKEMEKYIHLGCGPFAL